MPLITSQIPEQWGQLEDLVAAILNEAGLQARRGVSLTLPRGSANVDVFAEEAHDGIVHRLICECKNWRTNVPKEVIHAFRTVVHEAGVNRGYVISRAGFQAGAIEAARSTNIDLVTFNEFQEVYFTKWYNKRLWEIENEIGDFNVYYEPLGKPGYSRLPSEAERHAYDEVWNKYLFAGLILMRYSPYAQMIHSEAADAPTLPFAITKMEEHGIEIPNDIKEATGYREFFAILSGYAHAGLQKLRAVNPITRDIPPDRVERDD